MGTSGKPSHRIWVVKEGPIMKKLIHRTLLVALAVGITVFLVSVPNAARAKVHPTTARHFAKRGVKCGVGKIGNRSTQASSGVWTAITADSTVYPAPPGVDTPSLAQAQQSVYDEEAGQKALSSGDLGTAEADFGSSTDFGTRRVQRQCNRGASTNTGA